MDFDPLDLPQQARIKTQSDEAAKQKHAIELDDFRWLMEDKRGRRTVWRLLERTGVYRTSFTGNSETFFREGQRNIGLAILSLLHEACPEKYAIMHKEQRENGRRR